MHILIVFGTTEGHTAELAQFAADCLRGAGHQVTVEAATADSTGVRTGAYDAVILAASLHVGRYQAPLTEFARAQHDALAARPNAFISVSLSAAGENPDDWQGLEQCIARFEQETGWTPAAIHQAAGAIRYSQYDFFKRLTMKHIAAKRGQKTVTSRDYDLTDYDALRDFVLDFAAKAQGHAEAVGGP